MKESPSSSLLPSVIAVVALGVSVFTLWQQPAVASLPASPSLSPLSSPAGGQDLMEVHRRLKALEAKPPADLRVDPQGSDGVHRAAVPDPRLDDLLRRVGQLEAAQRAQPAAATAPSPIDVARAEAERILRNTARDAERAQAAGPARDKILDPRASETDKLTAWKALRDAGPDAWSDAVVDEMARLGLTSSDARLRADVWRQADARARSERLVPPLLRALVHDVDASVREEAAETLANYLDTPGVRAALESAAANDVDPKVKRQAMGSLAGG